MTNNIVVLTYPGMTLPALSVSHAKAVIGLQLLDPRQHLLVGEAVL